jgi:hypothetical protein
VGVATSFGSLASIRIRRTLRGPGARDLAAPRGQQAFFVNLNRHSANRPRALLLGVGHVKVRGPFRSTVQVHAPRRGGPGCSLPIPHSRLRRRHGVRRRHSSCDPLCFLLSFESVKWSRTCPGFCYTFIDGDRGSWQGGVKQGADPAPHFHLRGENKIK